MIYQYWDVVAYVADKKDAVDSRVAVIFIYWFPFP